MLSENAARMGDEGKAVRRGGAPTALLFVALEQRSAEMPLALSFIGGTQRHERRLAFTLSETIVMTRLASGPRQSVEALSFFA
jgi:hypothetical protein